MHRRGREGNEGVANKFAIVELEILRKRAPAGLI